MAKARSIYVCQKCGSQQPRWLGRCPECGAWDSLAEEQPAGPAPCGARMGHGPGPGSGSMALGEIELSGVARWEVGMPELDRVLGGGLVRGSVVLLGGEPGVGKSTLALQAAACLQARGRSVLYVTGEESPQQIRLRANRLPDIPGEIQILAETCSEAIAQNWMQTGADFVLIDSIQTLHSERVESAAGSVSQVRESAALLARVAKEQGTPLVLIGHVTKDGSLAGPRVLEHMVDVVLAFEGDRDHVFRLLRAEKNRFGSTQEMGVFTMEAHGLAGVSNPSELFLSERRNGVPGSCIVPIVEGSRPMLLELQVLVAAATYGTARRTSIGIEDGRVALLLAVLDRRTKIDLLGRDVYVNVAGGIKVGEPAADLAVCLAMVSSCLDLSIPPDVVACGEIGLGGEVRRIPRLDLRIAEATRLGFTRILVPGDGLDGDSLSNCELVPISNVGQAVAWLRSEGLASSSE